ncbi:hypothetical protein J1N35_021790 [Gossypium stocksii]|uniref:Uncharacterized protein n=1 Tax=Gossypium stocksii TaxID=47602 RepID=A0A9D4A2U1_9ROSI|nr:hypothetical protein J1N35_021790 [Gossypium stocksii]
MTDNSKIEKELTADKDHPIKLCIHETIGNRERRHRMIHPGPFRDLNLNIQESTSLKDDIEKTVKNGDLARFEDQGTTKQGQSSCGNPKGKKKVRGTIHVIMGTDENWALSKAGPLYGFTNHPVKVKGSITLPVTLGDGEHTTTKYIQIFVVDYSMAYNAIFGRSIMRMAKMVIAIFCMKIKFPTRTRVGFMRSDQ